MEDELALRVLMPAFAGTMLSEDWAQLVREGLGGLCLFGSNTGEGPDAVARLTAALRAARADVVVSIDEEGGDVTRLHTAEGSPVLGAAALGAVDDLDLTHATGAAVAADLRALGISLNLAPVADVNSNPDNPVIGTRSFSSDPQRAAAHVARWVAGHQDAGVAACVKHFPGHGDTAEDSHLAVPRLDAAWADLAARELVPFRAAVADGVAAVMTSHIVVSSLDADLPATLSPRVLGLLREEVGPDGVIVTDALDMAGASAGRGIPAAAVLALVAGADLLCLGADKDVALVREVQQAIVAALADGTLDAEQLASSAKRVARLAAPLEGGARTGGGPAPVPEARAALSLDGDLPDLAGALVVSVETGASIAVGEGRWGLCPDVGVRPGDALPTSRPLIVQVRDAHRRPDVTHLLQRATDEGPVVVIEWGWPGPYDVDAPRVCTRGCSQPAVAAVTELLESAGWVR